jgi:hypothetical protein
MNHRLLSACALFLLSAGAATAADNGNPLAGEADWSRNVPAKDGQPRSCVTCHGSDPRLPGRHVRTGKPISAMAPATEPTRFTDPAKVEKWFTRNCKWTWGRECSAEEKRDIRAWLHTF